MFGYIVCNKEGLSEEELQRYQYLYCGLCRRLGKKFGQLERWSLSYDMTFLILFLSSLYEPTETEELFRCAAHPFHKKGAIENTFTDYAADMTILLSYYKCLDDWEDERKYISCGYSKILENHYKTVEKRYPRQCKKVRESLDALHRVEQTKGFEPDLAVNYSGEMFSEIFVYKEDFWSGSLREFAYEMGRFIYLMDAFMDYEKDKKTGNYNPLLELQAKPEQIVPAMQEAIGKAAQEFEKLPMVQDEHLIKNILYGGVWQKYYLKLSKKEKENG